VIPVQAKGGDDRIGSVQTKQGTPDGIEESAAERDRAMVAGAGIWQDRGR